MTHALLFLSHVSPILSHVLHNLHVAVRAAVVGVRVELADAELPEGDLDDVPMRSPRRHQGHVTGGVRGVAMGPQHLNFVRPTHLPVVDVGARCGRRQCRISKQPGVSV